MFAVREQRISAAGERLRAHLPLSLPPLFPCLTSPDDSVCGSTLAPSQCVTCDVAVTLTPQTSFLLVNLVISRPATSSLCINFSSRRRQSRLQ